MAEPRRDRWILLIGIGKVIKTVTLLSLAAALLVLSRGDDNAARLNHWAFVLGINPGNHLLRLLVDQISSIAIVKLRLLAAGMVVYALLFGIEGYGLLTQKRWGEYVTVAITGSFVPIELYETIRHPHLGRAITSLLNIAAVLYLVHRIRSAPRPLSGEASYGKDVPTA